MNKRALRLLTACAVVAGSAIGGAMRGDSGIIPNSTVYAATYPVLKLGSHGSAVVYLQNRLNALGYNCGKADGAFGPNTLAAVKRFQKAKHLTADGIVGPKTWAALNSAASTTFSSHKTPKPAHKMYATQIFWNNLRISTPAHIVAPDPYSGNKINTSWLPIWYVYNALGKAGVKTAWDGHNLSLQTPKNMAVDLSKLPKLRALKSNEMTVRINEHTVLYAPKMVDIDPSSGKPTTFVPVYYLTQAVKRFGIQASWDGMSWKMMYGAASTSSGGTSKASGGSTSKGTGTSKSGASGGSNSGSGGATRSATPVTKLQTALDFARVLHIPGDSSGTNPFSDVPGSDWSVIHALVEKGYFVADSATKFGANDAVPISTLEHAYQLYCGIPDSHMAWNPGGNLAAWSDAVQLTKGVQSKSGNLSTADEKQMMQNLTYLYQGYSKDPDGTYHLWVRPWDGEPYYNVTQDFSVWGNPSRAPKDYFEVTQQQIQQDLAWAYHYLDSCTVTYDSKTGFETFKVPGVSAKDIYVVDVNYAGGVSDTPKAEYSLDGGKTWIDGAKWNGTYLSMWNSLDPEEGATDDPPAYVYARTNEFGTIEVRVFHDNTGSGIGLGDAENISFNADGIMHVDYQWRS